MGSQRVGHDLVTFRLTGWKNTKLNVILFKKKKANYLTGIKNKQNFLKSEFEKPAILKNI